MWEPRVLGMWVCRDVGFRGCGGQWSVWSRVPRVWFWHPGAWSPKGVGRVCVGGDGIIGI